ncbi:hypothetical protein ACH5RR_022960 [Cinchona calisaya]|uniref:LisH domain-containing protein n=1 Tax=Cinchona calisaya TaxID=153742 RepID=A0ABD2Z9C0_9GENT
MAEWSAKTMLCKYIYDYMKKNMNGTAEIFAKEAGVDTNAPPAVDDSPEGFLEDWWSLWYGALISSRLPQAVEGESSSEPVATTGNFSLKPVPDVCAKFPAIPAFFAKMYVQEYLNHTKVNDVEKLTPDQLLIPSSTNSSQQPPEILEKLQQLLNSEDIQKQQLARDAIINVATSKASVPIPQGEPNKADQDNSSKKEKFLMQQFLVHYN